MATVRSFMVFLLCLSVLLPEASGCLKYKYDLSKSLFNLHAVLNNVSLFETPLTARNSPPICIPVPALSSITICVRVRDIRWEDQKLHVCANLELQLSQTPVIVLPFDCVYIGAGGIGVDKSTTVSGGNGLDKSTTVSGGNGLDKTTTVSGGDGLDKTTTAPTTSNDTKQAL